MHRLNHLRRPEAHAPFLLIDAASGEHVFRDTRLEQEFPSWGGLSSSATPIFEDLSSYLGQSLDTIAQEYWEYRDREDVTAQQRVAHATEEATVSAYYATTPHYLYELSYWEASREKQAWFRVLALAARKYHWQTMLDFGGGVGGLALFLRTQGIACDYLDIPGKTFEYAKWRFERHRFPVTMYDGTTPRTLPSHTYHAVVTWDVLEHLFDLEGALDLIARILQPQGWCLSKSTFASSDGHHCHIHLAQHAQYDDVKAFNALMERHHFHYVGQLKPNACSRLLRALGLRGAVAGILIVPRLKHGGNFLAHRSDGERLGTSAA